MDADTTTQLTLTSVRLDERDRRLLENLARHERLPQSEIIRQSIRAYARRAGIADTPKRQRRSA